MTAIVDPNKPHPTEILPFRVLPKHGGTMVVCGGTDNDNEICVAQECERVAGMLSARTSFCT